MKETDSKKKRREIRKRRRIRLEEKKREKIGKIPAEERKFFLKIGSKPRYKIAAVAIVIILVSCGFFYYFQQPADVPAPSMVFGDGISPFKAAIIDHLSLSMPNQAFVDTSINILQEAGFTIDYYEGDRVTVELYRSLPTHHYDLIILRVHSSATELRGEEFVEGNVIFFTSEPYSTTKYVYEQSTGQLGKCAFNTPNSIYYFSIPPKFVASSMEGKFNNTVIIMMGCEGLSNTIMAEAFIEKDARAYTGWDGPVSADHTDEATIFLLQQLVTQKRTISEAMEEVMKEIGHDPEFNSNDLLYYPVDAGDYTILT